MNYYLKRRILFLAFLSFCVILQAQREEKRISGHVRDSQDLPLAGVNIKVKNTPYGAISNEKGEYVLKGLLVIPCDHFDTGQFDTKIQFVYQPLFTHTLGHSPVH